MNRIKIESIVISISLVIWRIMPPLCYIYKE